MSATLIRLAVAPERRIMAGRAIGLALAVTVIGATLAAMGRSPLTLGALVLHSTIGSRFGLEDLALFMTPLMLTGASVWIGIRVGLWNIGAEGQFYAGAIAASWIGLFQTWPPIVALPLMGLAGIAGGVAWAALPAACRAWLGVSEIVTTLLLNFVASLFVYYLATGPWADHVTNALASTGRLHVHLPQLWGAVHLGAILSVAVVVALAAFLARSRFGYESSIVGANPEAARYAGIPVARNIAVVLLASGGLAGLAGMIEVSGTVHRLQGGLANNYGYLGIVVAILARRRCLALIPASLLMAFILDTGIVLQTAQVSASAVLAITGLVMLTIAVADELAQYGRAPAMTHPPSRRDTDPMR